MSLSVIMPTMGRATLERAVKSVVHQLEFDDELLVICDGHNLQDEVTGRIGTDVICHDVRVYATLEKTGHSGAEQRDKGITLAIGTNIMFLDDDDIYVRGALATVRRALSSSQGLPHIFRMQYGSTGKVLWEDAPLTPRLRGCNVGTPMLVIPNVKGLPKWNPLSATHDFEFASHIVTNMFAGHVEWHQEVLSIIRPTEGQSLSEIP